MCLTENIIEISCLVLFILSFALPLLYITSCALNKRKRAKFKKYLLRGLGIFIIMSLSQYGINQINRCEVPGVAPDPSVEPENPVVLPAGYILTTPKGYTLIQKDGAYYIDDYLLVNKSYPLTEDWVPYDTYQPIMKEVDKQGINVEAYAAWQNLRSDASAVGLNLYVASAYRSYKYQADLYQYYVKKDGVERADTYSARPGHSEHQTGLAIDLNTVEDSFALTGEGKWVNKNAYLYGFIIRYPQNKTSETGYKYEPWHLRYVGLELASILYNDGDWISMEDYFGLDSKY